MSSDGSQPAAAAMARPVPRWLGPTVDYGPLLVFSLAYVGLDILSATAAMVVATLIVLVLSFAITRRVPLASLIVSLTVIAFGSLTLWLDDPRYLKIQSTLTNLLFGLVLLVAFLLRQPLLRLFFGAALDMSDEGWRHLTMRFIAFFLTMATLNEIVARTQSEEVWAAYYSFGSTILAVLFVAAQYPLIRRETEAKTLAEKETSQP